MLVVLMPVAVDVAAVHAHRAAAQLRLFQMASESPAGLGFPSGGDAVRDSAKAAAITTAAAAKAEVGPPASTAEGSACFVAEDARQAQQAQHAQQALCELQQLLRLNLANIEPLSRGPAEILPHLLLGSCDDARNVHALHALGVTHVLNCAGGSIITGPELYHAKGIGYSEFSAEDTQGYNIMEHYGELMALADQVTATQGRLFVHCQAGVNRSGTLCLAYHCERSGMPLLDSARHCKARRGRICTNPAFQYQVFRYAQQKGLSLM